MSPIRLILIAVIGIVATACGSPSANDAPAGKNAPDVARPGGAAVQETPAETRGASATAACYEVKTGGDRAVLRSQTFAIDFEPFKNSCFVTTHDPDFTNPPLNSEIAIYKDGKRLQAFRVEPPGDSRLDSSETGLPTSGCWVEAVAFQDVNADALTDVIVVAKCGTKSGAYNENLVYINNNKILFTRPDVNVRLSDFKTVKEILQFTAEHPRDFSLITDASDRNRQS